MGRHGVWRLLAGATACMAASLAVTAAPAAGAVARASGWRTAIEVPGLASLSKGLGGVVRSVSCASPGNCVAGGFYELGTDQGQAFVVSEANGRWGKAIKVRRPGALTPAVVNSVSCPSPGNCAAGGWMSAGPETLPQGFVVTERNGRWGTAMQEPGPGVLGTESSVVDSVSCASAGNCAVGGYTFGSHTGQAAFLASETAGEWHPALALKTPGSAEVFSVSCTPDGTCQAGGSYADSHGHLQAFVAIETDGIDAARSVPGLAALNKGGQATVSEVSCTSAGDCSAGGYYTDSRHRLQAYVVSERNRAWGTAIEVPGSAALNARNAEVNSVSCGSAGNCAAGGSYTDGRGHPQAFVVSETNGRWHRAIEVPGSGALNTGGSASVRSVSCASAGNCAAGGDYTDGHGHGQAMVVRETNGTWGRAIEVPGSGALNTGGSASVASVSCASAGSCSAGGWYSDRLVREQAFVV